MEKELNIRDLVDKERERRRKRRKEERRERESEEKRYFSLILRISKYFYVKIIYLRGAR